MSTLVCIGGPWDGKWYDDKDEERTILEVVEHETQDITPDRDHHAYEVAVVRHVYHRQTLFSQLCTHQFWMHTSLTCDEVIERLLQRYAAAHDMEEERERLDFESPTRHVRLR